MALLDRVLEQLREDYFASNKRDLFEQLKKVLTGDSERIHYQQLAQDLGLSEGAVKVAVHRIRKKYRERLRSEISQTVENIKDIDDEMRHLLSALEN
jgi:uncharacterized protein YnzC (UPF0291/DUF896 family)